MDFKKLRYKKVIITTINRSKYCGILGYIKEDEYVVLSDLVIMFKDGASKAVHGGQKEKRKFRIDAIIDIEEYSSEKQQRIEKIRAKVLLKHALSKL